MAQERVRVLEDAILAVTAIPAEYLSWLGAAEYAAVHGFSGDSEASAIAHHAESTGTRGPGDFGAMLIVEEERKAMRRRIPKLRARLIEHVGQDDDRVGELG